MGSRYRPVPPGPSRSATGPLNACACTRSGRKPSKPPGFRSRRATREILRQMSERARRRRRKQIQGCGVALVFLGGFAAAVALAIGAFTADAPVNGIYSIVLGLGAIAINRA